MKNYKAHSSIKYIIALSVFFVIIVSAILITDFRTYLDFIDNREFIKIKFEEGQNTVFNVCDDINIDINKSNITNEKIGIFPRYTVYKYDEERGVFLSVNSNEETIGKYTEIKSVRYMEPGDEVFYGVTALPSEDTCEWDPGIYRITLNYDYFYRITKRFGSESQIVIEVLEEENN